MNEIGGEAYRLPIDLPARCPSVWKRRRPRVVKLAFAEAIFEVGLRATQGRLMALRPHCP